MFAAFWALLRTIERSFRRAPGPLRLFVLCGCGALAVGTLQGPVQAVPAVKELLDRGGDAGDVIVNLHAQLNMLGGLMVLLVGAVVGLLPVSGITLPFLSAGGSSLVITMLATGMLANVARQSLPRPTTTSAASTSSRTMFPPRWRL